MWAIACLSGAPISSWRSHLLLVTSCQAYAIYWSKSRNELRATGTYKASGAAGSFVDACNSVILDANGDGPVARVKNSGEALFVPDVSASSLKRKELAFMYGVTQLACIPFEDGVLEFGNTRAHDTDQTCARGPNTDSPNTEDRIHDA